DTSSVSQLAVISMCAIKCWRSSAVRGAAARRVGRVATPSEVLPAISTATTRVVLLITGFYVDVALPSLSSFAVRLDLASQGGGRPPGIHYNPTGYVDVPFARGTARVV